MGSRIAALRRATLFRPLSVYANGSKGAASCATSHLSREYLVKYQWQMV